MDDLRVRLLDLAYLYDDPSAYTAGVEAALAAVATLVTADARRTASAAGAKA